MLPSVGDKNAFAGICTLSEYYPSSLNLNERFHFLTYVCNVYQARSQGVRF